MKTALSGFTCFSRSAFIVLLACACLCGCRIDGNHSDPAISGNADLAGLAISNGLLDSSFSPNTLSYGAMFVGQATVTVTPTAAASGATIRVNGAIVASGQASQAIALNPGPNAITVSVTAADGTTKTYTITANQLAQQAYAKASNTAAGDLFGCSVALSGDTMAVGAPCKNSYAGAVYIFIRDSSGVWSQQAYLNASNAQAYDQFGDSLTLSGDTLAVGATGEDSNAKGLNGNQADNSMMNSGAVYIFSRSGTTWTQQAYVNASNTEEDDNFGWSLALAGDTLAVAAVGEDSSAKGVGGSQANGASASGAAYVFSRSGTTWTQQAYIKASNTEAGDLFGCSLALDGDTLAVGANQEASNATGVNGNQNNDLASDSGAVYVFSRSGAAWAQQAYIKASNTEAYDKFGRSLALDGDILAVGATGEASNAHGVNGNQADNSMAISGAAYVFSRSGGAWTQRAYVKASNTQADDYFGYSVALSGGTLAVGAPYEDSLATGVGGSQADGPAGSSIDSGAVYLFR